MTLFLSWVFNKWNMARFTMLILVLFIWCIESTRTFSNTEMSDFPSYLGMFDSLGKMPLLRLIFNPSSSTVVTVGGGGVEYGWQVFNRIGYFLFQGNFFHFAYCVIAISYYIVFCSVYKYFRSLGANFRFFLCAISFLAFLSSYFSICNNLFRQQVSMSIVVYAIVSKVVDNKCRWFLLLIATSLHSMCIGFFPLLFWKFDKKPTLRIIIIALCIMFVCYILIQHVNFFTIISLGVVQKLATASDYAGSDVMETAAAIKYLIIVVFIYCVIVVLHKNTHPNILAMMNITIIMAFLYVILEPLPLIQIRYYITRFVFLPFIVPFLFGKNNIIGNIYTLGVILLFFVMFFNGEYEHFKFTLDNLLYRSFFNYNLY